MGALNRRHLFAAAPALVVVGFAAPALASAGADDALAYAVRESREINAIVARLNSLNCGDDEWDAWVARDNAFMKWAEALPVTPQFAKAKAVAFRTIYDRNGGIDEFCAGEATTDVRLARQIIKCTLGAH